MYYRFRYWNEVQNFLAENPNARLACWDYPGIRSWTVFIPANT